MKCTIRLSAELESWRNHVLNVDEKVVLAEVNYKS